MPALIFMGRRWGVSSDELAIPSLCGMALRVMWSVILLLVLFTFGEELTSCRRGWLMNVYLWSSISTFILSAVVECGIMRVSTRGSIADTAARENLGGYLGAHMILGMVQLGMGVLGIVLATLLDSMCDSVQTETTVKILFFIVACSQIADVLVMSCCYLLMRGNSQAIGGTSYLRGSNRYQDFERLQPTEIEGQWQSRCHGLYGVLKVVTCGVFGGGTLNETDFGQLARIMARIFHTEEYLDVVPSDIAAGIVLLYHKQRRERLAEGREPTVSLTGSSEGESKGALSAQEVGECASLNSGNVGGGVDGGIPSGMRKRSLEHTDFYRVSRKTLVDVADPAQRKALQEIWHFSQYALAIYTWYLYVFARPCSGACDLLCYSCTGRARAFRKARSTNRWSTDSVVDENAAADADADADPSTQQMEGPGRGAPGYYGAPVHEGQRASVAVALGSDESPNCPASVAGSSIQVEMAPGSEGGTGRLDLAGSQLSGEGSSRSGRGNGSVPVPLRGDNWLGIHEAGLLRVAGLHRGCEVVDAQFASGVNMTPYCLLVDHEWRCVVISIRGTMSLEDCLCDLHAEPQHMEEPGRKWGFDGRGMYAHQGVFARAEWMMEDLDAQGHLRTLLGPESETNPRPRCRSYSLYVTGHSLGGSTGVLLAYMLRRDYPSVRCVSITPLGGLLDKEHAESCGEFVLSAVMGDDFVPRLSVTSMEHMRDEVLELIARSKANKLTVMRSVVRNMCRPWRRRRPRGSSSSRDLAGEEDLGTNDLGRLVYSESDEIPETQYSSQLRRYKEWVSRKDEFPVLLPAGRLVHYVKTHTIRHRGISWCCFSCCCDDPCLFTPVWAKPSDFKDIVVSRRMLEDHIPTISCPRFEKTYQMLVREAEGVGNSSDHSILPNAGGVAASSVEDNI